MDIQKDLGIDPDLLTEKQTAQVYALAKLKRSGGWLHAQERLKEMLEQAQLAADTAPTWELTVQMRERRDMLTQILNLPDWLMYDLVAGLMQVAEVEPDFDDDE